MPKSLPALMCGVICVFSLAAGALADPPEPTEPRIVNIYNFCRNTDYRVGDSEKQLLNVVIEQIRLVHANGLRGTWALQYDALVNPEYQKLMKEQLNPDDEVGAWLEIPRRLVEKAGLKWRGAHDWEPTCNVDYFSAYIPEERRKLVDAYMADFRSIFGYYPRTVGCWYLDEVTLAYLIDKYGIVASCNSQDKVKPNDDPKSHATLWGGYWNQAYYPSKFNAYMPAQTSEGQINVPIFRMQGSDPIYQYARGTATYCLEPHYPFGGGSTAWVDWYFRNKIEKPSLAFAYAQVGQENSLSWDSMKQGLAYQLVMLAENAKAGKIRVETLRESGEWFKSHFKLTPPTSVVCLDDWRHQGRKSVWYNSRYYRVNLLWDKDGPAIRDLHCFNEKKVSSTYDTAMKVAALRCETLPIVEGTLWATEGKDGSAVPVAVGQDGQCSPLDFDGDPAVNQTSATELRIVQPVKGGGALTIVCAESALTFTAVDAQQHPVIWAWELQGGSAQTKAVIGISDNHIEFNVDGFHYSLRLHNGAVVRSPDGAILLQAANTGKLGLIFHD